MELDLVQFFFREKLYNEMLRSAESGLKNDPSDLTANLYIGVAHFLNSRLNEALSQLEPLVSEPNISLAALLALLYVHKRCEVPDKKAIQQGELLLKEEKKLPHEIALFHAANVLYMIGKLEKSSDYLHKLMKLNPESLRGLVLKGWIELNGGNKKSALSYFRSALNKDQFCMDAALGEVRTIAPVDGLAKLNQLIVKYPNLSPPLVEKMKLHLSLFDWQLTLDTSKRILTMDKKNLTAIQIKLLYLTCYEGNYPEVSSGLHQFHSMFDEQEPQNWTILYDWSVLFARTCGRDDAILAETRRLLEKALLIAGNNITLLNELAYQFYLSKKYKEAVKYYRNALKIDESSLTALTGLTSAAISENGVTSQIKQQVDFLLEIAPDSKRTPEILILQAMCESDVAKVVDLCNKVISEKVHGVSSLPFGCAYLRLLNPDLIISALNLFPIQVEYAERMIEVLKKLCQLCPGLVYVWSLLASVQATCEMYDEAMKTLKHIIDELDPGNAKAHLLMAKIHKEKGNFNEANISLELGLSYNLKVREQPLFHLLNGILKKHQGDATSAISSLKNALVLNTGEEKLSEPDLVTLYTELSNCHKEMNQFLDASECLREATQIFDKTKFESVFVISNADLALSQNNVTSALSMLSTVTPDQPYYMNAKMKMAEIHLKYNKDGHLFAECYRELTKKDPTAENFVRLADAYMSIQEPEKAIESYEKAMKTSADPELACKLARVLIKTHQYAQAVKRYRESGDVGCIELGMLFFKLGQLQAAENCLSNIPSAQKVFVLAKIYEKKGDLSKACKLLQETLEKIGQNDKDLVAKICKQLAEYSTSLRDFDAAIGYYKKWLSIMSASASDGELIPIQIALAKLYLQVNDWKACEDICRSIVSKHPNNEPALLMMADLAFRRCDFTAADLHFSTLISRHPTYFVAIARLIEVKRRLGVLHEAKPILDKIESSSKNESGFNYCLGLFNWYSGNDSEAMNFFNLARFDSEWGQQALHNMVEICLIQTDGQELGQKLLSEMKPSNPEEEMNCKLLEAFLLLASKDSQKIDKAMTTFTSLANHEMMKIGATLGLSTGYILSKQSSRAKNVLKRIAKTPWQFEEAEYLERCWLMLADLHIQSNKYELATELLKRVLTHNQACTKAYEYYGLIAEKDQKYNDASSQYQKAWQLTQKLDLNLGAKLATNLLKAKRYADAIDVCLNILSSNPGFPRLQKDVLEKAINHLKT